MSKPWLWLSVLALLLVLLLLRYGSGMIETYARQMLYPAPPVPVPSPPPPPLEEVWLDLPTGDRVLAWAYTPNDLRAEAPVVLFFHGNGENLETVRWAGLFEELGRLGVAVVASDYPGYGRSTGVSSEEGLNATGDAALAWVRQRHAERPVVIAGWSLGAALALIAMSPWTTLREVAVGIFPEFAVKAMLRETYDSRAAARTIRVPALVIHGERDDLIPVEHGKEIASVLGGSTRWVPVSRAAHNDLLGRREVWQEIERFLSGL
jgi:uncharacterized protein